MNTRRFFASSLLIALSSALLFAAPDHRRPHKKIHIKPHHHIKHRPVRYHPRPKHYRVIPPHHRPGRLYRRLPSSVFWFTLGGIGYYYGAGIYYRHYPYGYVIVRPPVGAVVPALPSGFGIVEIDGVEYFISNNTYYLWDETRNGYRVIEVIEDEGDERFEEVQTSEGYTLGALFTRLPEGAEAHSLKGVQYYRYGKTWFLPSVQSGKVLYIVVKPPEQENNESAEP